MKPIQIACVLGLTVALSACSDNDPSAAIESSNNDGSSGLQNDLVTAAPILSVDNYTGIVGYALRFYAEQTLPGPQFTSPAPQDFSQPQSTTTDPATGLESANFTCSNGGTATRTGRVSDSDIFQFQHCQNGDSLLDGQLGFEIGKYNFNQEFINFTADVNGAAAIHTVTSGEINNYTGNACGSQYRTRSVVRYTITQGEEVFELKDWNTSVNQVQPIAPICDTSTIEISGQYSVRSIDTGNNWLMVNATETVTGSAFNPNAGVITITADDASTVSINFATDDDTTVAMTITNHEGESTFDEPLTTWIGSLLRSGLNQD